MAMIFRIIPLHQQGHSQIGHYAYLWRERQRGGENLRCVASYEVEGSKLPLKVKAGIFSLYLPLLFLLSKNLFKPNLNPSYFHSLLSHSLSTTTITTNSFPFSLSSHLFPPLSISLLPLYYCPPRGCVGASERDREERERRRRRSRGIHG